MNLDKLFNPGSVAIIGASPKEGSAGGRILSNLIEGGFEGPIYPINRTYAEVMGLTAYPDLSSVGEPVDLAMVAVTQPPFKERILGETRLIHEPYGKSAELAIFIGDRWQGKGLGRKLLEVLIEVARGRGLKKITGWVMRENKNMLRLCESLGFIKSFSHEEGAQRVEIEL